MCIVMYVLCCSVVDESGLPVMTACCNVKYLKLASSNVVSEWLPTWSRLAQVPLLLVTEAALSGDLSSLLSKAVSFVVILLNEAWSEIYLNTYLAPCYIICPNRNYEHSI